MNKELSAITTEDLINELSNRKKDLIPNLIKEINNSIQLLAKLGSKFIVDDYEVETITFNINKADVNKVLVETDL